MHPRPWSVMAPGPASATPAPRSPIQFVDVPWRLESGDCLAMRLNPPIVHRNPTRKPARR